MKSSSFLQNLKKRNHSDEPIRSSNSNSNGQHLKSSNLIEDIEDEDHRPYKQLKSSQASTSSSPPNYVINSSNNKNKSPPSSFSSSFANKKLNGNNSKTSPTHSQTSIASSSTTHFELDDEESFKFKCILGDKCTDKSEYHLKEYTHPSATTKPSKTVSQSSSSYTKTTTLTNTTRSTPTSQLTTTTTKSIDKDQEKIEEKIKIDKLEEESVDDLLSFTVVEKYITKKKPVQLDIDVTSPSLSETDSKSNSDNSDSDNQKKTTTASAATSTSILTNIQPKKPSMDITELDDTILTRQPPYKKKGIPQSNISSNNSSSNNIHNYLTTKPKDPFSIYNFKSKGSAVVTTSGGKTSPTIVQKQQDTRMWVDKFIPKTEEDLVVNKKKQTEVKLWLQDRLKELNDGIEIREKLLILTGPSGAGKSSLIRVLGNSMQFEITDWENPPMVLTTDQNDQLTSPYAPQLEQFRNWLKFSTRGASLFTKSRLNVVLIEEYPNLSGPTQQEEFRKIFLQLLDSGRYPVVLVISDENTGNSPLNQILPVYITSKPTVKHVSFNCIPPVTLQKHLQKLAQLEGYPGIPTTQIESFVRDCAGDVRAAINSLQFYCVGKLKQSSTSIKKPTSAKSKSKSLTTSSDNATVNSNEFIEVKHRDSTYSLFHSIGKLLYNKRIPRSNIYDKDQCWYKEKYHRQIPENVPEEIFENSHADFQSFVGFVHENYLSFYQSIDEVSQSLDYLSDSDIMMNSEGVQHYRTGGNRYLEGKTGGVLDQLPQCSISLVMRGFAYSHTQISGQSFYHFVKPRLTQFAEQNRNLQDQLPLCIQSLLDRYGSGFREVPGSLIELSKPMFIYTLPIIHRINFHANQNRQCTTYSNNSDLTSTIMKNQDFKVLLDNLSKFSTKSFYEFSYQKENQVSAQFASITEMDEELDSPDLPSQPTPLPNFKNNNNNNKNSDNGDYSQIINKLGNNEVLIDDDIIEEND
ncbi:hypothetical protein DLAC_05670 [Tieghemostelium lacteum]|uniref:Checkpoint protein RAD24-like helical bundle domain-containing protein n=1 Tax=Tieghemostelium lacteum TaxID=361077 RepID=A0A151ZGM1_TIELA|nr:hypothetical protein DLAC_05670 [Tieghemostelium lacteum]|eukprot:KYQ93059.1 hypothetical protein DLAC_05670 [Tieghemostelium lacteum]